MILQAAFWVASQSLLLLSYSGEVEPMTVPAYQDTTPPAVGEAPFSARELVSESYDSGGALIPAERAFQLGYLANAAATVGEPNAVSWAEEGLALAQHLAVSWNQLALEKNLLIAIATPAPQTAMKQLCLLDPPVKMDDGSIPEDVRSDSAKLIFDRYWGRFRVKGLEEIQRVSVCLGDTGQFPFAAVTPVIKDLSQRRSNDDALSLFRTALSYINRRPEIEAGDEEIVTMLLGLQGAVPDWALVEAIRPAVKRLTDNSATSLAGNETKTTFTALAYSKHGTQQYSSRKDLLLARLLPEIQRLDASLAERIIQEHPALGSGKDAGVDRFESVTILGSTDPATMIRLQVEGLENNRLKQVQQLAPTDPKAALDLANTISNPSIRSQAMSTIASQTQESDPELAARLLRDARRDLGSLTDVPDRIQATASAVRAAAAVHDERSAEELLRSALKLGTDFWKEELDMKPVQAAPFCRVFEPLTELVQVGSQVDPQWTVEAVRNLEPLQRSYLLIFAAEGVHNARLATTK